jgi:uncharacterized surface protein with fasciclin (FAS1) repeats
MIMYRLATALLIALATTHVIALDPTSLRSTVPRGVQQAERKLQADTIAEFIDLTPSLSTLLTAVNRADLVGVVSNPLLDLTFFAPTNDAFSALDPELFALLLTPGYFQHLQNVLLYHVLDGSTLSTDLLEGLAITMVNEEVVTVSVDGTTGTVSLINSAGVATMVSDVDNVVSNGVVHAISGVLLPSFVYRSVIDLAARYSIVVSLIEMAGLEAFVRNGFFTLFAPNNDAFEALMETVEFLTSEEGGDELFRILSYHLLSTVVTAEKVTDGAMEETVEGSPVTFAITGGVVTVDGATVTELDILAVNGVTHGIDRVLTPPAPPPTSSPTGRPTTSAPTLVPTTSAPTPVPVTIVDLAVATPSLAILVTAVTTAGLTEALDNPVARLTVFAPSNDAFFALPTALFSTLLTPEFGQHLSNVLQYHVIGSIVFSTDLSDGMEVTMLNGETITVGIDGDNISLLNGEGDASMVSSIDVSVTNGVVRLIDGVLLPSFIYRTVVDLSADYSTLFSLVSLAGLEETLNGDAWTLFAPTNAAFGALPAETLSFLASPGGLETLTGILTYHALPVVLTSEKLSDGAVAATTQGSTVTIGITDGAITVNDIAVVDADILAINGVTHGIDGVLMPPPTSSPTGPPTTSAPTPVLTTTLTLVPTTYAPTPMPMPIVDIAAASPSLSTLVVAVTTAGLADVLGDPTATLTLFAPTDDAFTRLPNGTLNALLTPAFRKHLMDVLLYHVVGSVVLSTELSDGLEVIMLNGENITVGIDGDNVSLTTGNGVNTTVSAVDITASNGVVHLIDGVLLPSFIFRTVIDLGASYSTLFSLIELTALGETLNGDAWTLFAPTNAAFERLPEETVRFLTSLEGLETLTGILAYHVVADVLTSDKLSDGAVATTAQGSTVTIGITNGTITVNDIAVVDADILAINGVTHGTDGVLIPPPTSSPTGPPTTSAPTPVPTTSVPTLVPTTFVPTLMPTTSAPTPVPQLETDPPTVSPGTSSPTAGLQTASPAASSIDPTIVDIAAATPSLSTLVVAVTTAGLMNVLADPAATLTVFAPTNDAFSKLPNSTLNTLLNPAFSKHLTDVLLYHVIGSVVLFTELSDGLEVIMLNDETVTVGIDGDNVSLTTGNGVNTMVSAVDITASNGVVHLIDGVLLPSFIYRTVIDLGASYSTLFSLIELTALEETLNGDAWTLFAPTNAAFERLPEETVGFLTSLEGLETLTGILAHHVVADVLTSDKLSDGAVATTAQGSTVKIGITFGVITVNDIAVFDADILAINGVTHGIVSVLMPPQPEAATPTVSPGTSSPTTGLETASPVNSTIVDIAVATPSLSTLVVAVTTAGLADVLGDPTATQTVFAPTNDAFTRLPNGTLNVLLTFEFNKHLTDVLMYHMLRSVVLSTELSDGLEVIMLNDETVTVGIDGETVSLTTGNGVNTTVFAVDITASNGVVHLIDGVLLPSFIYRTVIDLGMSYSTLLALIELAGLREALTGGRFTLFAPDDDAFGKLPQTTLDFLTDLEGRDSLTDLLTYHVVSTVLTSDKLTDGSMATTLQGGTVTIGISEDTVTVNGSSTVTEADILAMNGVTHGIDTVLIPRTDTSAPTMAPSRSAGVALCTSFLGLFAMILAMAF